MRHPCSVAVVLILLGLLPARAEGSEPAPATLGPGLHLLVDDVMVARRTGLTRRVHPCEKLDAPVLEAEKPWESQRLYVYGSARYDDRRGELLLWYMSRGADPGRRDPRLPPGGDLVMVATSGDGVHWRRPNLGRFSFDGDSDTNIVFTMHSPSILFDPEETDPERRYKMLGHVRGGYRAAYSADGLAWTLYPKNPVIAGGDTITLSFNPATGEYLAFFKRPATVRGYARRSVYVATSTDMQQWSDAQLVMAPDEEDDRWAKTPPERTEFYNMSVFPRGGQFLGLVTVFKLQRVQTVQRGGDQSSHDGPLDVQLVYARDPRRWSRCDDRRAVIPRGPAAYDAGSILGVSNIPVIRDDRMWFYYTAMTTTHGGALPEKKMSVGRASWRLDGMVSLEAGEEEAVLETVPLAPGVRRLEVNADASRGRLVVEVLDAEGRPLPGYTAADCVPLVADRIHHPVRWTNHEQIPEATGLRLRVHLRRAEVFSLRLGL